jgi:hypothetical protein
MRNADCGLLTGKTNLCSSSIRNLLFFNPQSAFRHSQRRRRKILLGKPWDLEQNVSRM